MQINLERRIKRQAWPHQWDMFAVCPPGLESICADELTRLEMEGVEPTQGGVSFRAKLGQAYEANLWLRSASRVLLRLSDFRVRRFSDLVRHADTAPWEMFLAPGIPLKVQVTLHQSNLRHSGEASEAVWNAIQRRMAGLGLAGPKPLKPHETGGQSVMVRGLDRRAAISLDTSGEHLHRRGYRQDSAKAPMRENLAAALLMFCGYDGSMPLLDPMCGSGTLAIEAALMARNIPPALNRGLAMEDWPAHRPKTWQHLKNQAQAAMLAKAPQPILARDHQTGAINAVQANGERAGVAGDLEVSRGDIFKEPPPETGPGLLVCNPPYGKRLGSVRQAQAFVSRLGQRLSQAYQGWRVGVVLYRPEWLEALPLTRTEIMKAPHGGLTVSFVTGVVSSRARR